MSQVVTARKIARHYNAGLEDAIASTQAHNDQVAHDLLESGATGKDINRALLPIPERCPENLDGRFVRKSCVLLIGTRCPAIQAETT